MKLLLGRKVTILLDLSKMESYTKKEDRKRSQRKLEEKQDGRLIEIQLTWPKCGPLNKGVWKLL